MKRGYHSTQPKYFNVIPRTQFLGIALGFAIGLFFTGFFRLDNSYLQIIGAVLGYAVGWWLDGKYFAEKDAEIEDSTEKSED